MFGTSILPIIYFETSGKPMSQTSSEAESVALSENSSPYNRTKYHSMPSLEMHSIPHKK